MNKNRLTTVQQIRTFLEQLDEKQKQKYHVSEIDMFAEFSLLDNNISKYMGYVDSEAIENEPEHVERMINEQITPMLEYQKVLARRIMMIQHPTKD